MLSFFKLSPKISENGVCITSDKFNNYECFNSYEAYDNFSFFVDKKNHKNFIGLYVEDSKKQTAFCYLFYNKKSLKNEITKSEYNFLKEQIQTNDILKYFKIIEKKATNEFIEDLYKKKHPQPLLEFMSFNFTPFEHKIFDILIQLQKILEKYPKCDKIAFINNSYTQTYVLKEKHLNSLLDRTFKNDEKNLGEIFAIYAFPLTNGKEMFSYFKENFPNQYGSLNFFNKTINFSFSFHQHKNVEAISFTVK